MAHTLPIDLYQQIEQQYGKDLATQISKTVETVVVRMEEEAKILVVQKKSELKEELLKELASKADIAELRGKIETLDSRLQGEIKNSRLELDRKFTIIFLILFFTTIFVNKETLTSF